MTDQLAFIVDIRNFLYSGGDVLWLILGVAICLWCLIIERLIFFRQDYPALRASCIDRWKQRDDKISAYALYIRQELISEVFIQMNRGVSVIKVLIALCPLLGLLGTVTGMIDVFDVMAVT
ncbi:MAG: MotA/TolQ/ExbB proton channel family protein, partial [Gammaproteobacteria bacterium]